MDVFLEEGILPFKVLGHFSIEQYIREAVVSNKQLTRYYTWKDGTIGYKKKLPLDYVQPEFKALRFIHPHHLKPGFKMAVVHNYKMVGTIDHFSDIKAIREHKTYSNATLRLYDVEAKDYVTANPNQAGKPASVVINGQAIYSGKVRDFAKNKMMDAIKKNAKHYLKEALTKTINIVTRIDYPVLIVVELVDTIINQLGKGKATVTLGQKWDVDNRLYPYEKAIIDMLTHKGILLDDERLCVTGTLKIFTPLEDSDDSNRKLNIIIYRDERKIVRNNNYYQLFRENRQDELKQTKQKVKTKKERNILLLEFPPLESTE